MCFYSLTSECISILPNLKVFLKSILRFNQDGLFDLTPLSLAIPLRMRLFEILANAYKDSQR